MQYKSILNLVGNTPIIKLKSKQKNNLLAKLEYYNPAGSIKTRIAKEIILTSLKNKIITKKTPIIEPTSGNTGIGLSFVCACLGMKFISIMPDNVNEERIKLIRSYGGEVILTPSKDGMKGSIDKSKQLKEELNGFTPSQFENYLNPLTHYLSTAKEILKQTKGNIDYVIMGIGTGGTITGVGKYLKEKTNAKIIGVEPISSPLISQGYYGKHNIIGIGANIVSSFFDRSVIDDIITIKDEDAFKARKKLATTEGVFVGISSGAIYQAALKLSKKVKNKTILMIFPDNGERYLSMDI